MDHVAIMKKSWGLTQKILSGEKKIESRWYKTKHSPWGKIKRGDTIYFKDAGQPVSIKAWVEKTIHFSDLVPNKARKILHTYGKDDGISKDRISYFYKLFKDKRYCILIFLKNPRKVKSFTIDKRGFGMQAAWLTVKNINRIQN
ncbi:MAG: ASCH domain-containing protein [Patescibacteria group bacterium]